MPQPLPQDMDIKGRTPDCGDLATLKKGEAQYI